MEKCLQYNFVEDAFLDKRWQIEEECSPLTQDNLSKKEESLRVVICLSRSRET